MNDMTFADRVEAGAVRQALLSDIEVQALIPVKMHSNTTNMSDEELFDLVCLAPIDQTRQIGDVSIVLVPGTSHASWPAGYKGFECDWVPNVQLDDFYVWMQVRFAVGTAREHARFAAFCGIGIKEHDGLVTLIPEPRVAFL